MAIAGEGFFVLNGEQVGRPGQTLFSRAGQFRVDKDGFVVNPSGARLQGQPVGANDELQSTTADLAVQRTNIAPRQTTEISLALNLDARTAVRGGRVIMRRQCRFSTAWGNPMMLDSILSALAIPLGMHIS